MVTVHLSALDFANIRFGVSPLWECVAAFRVARRPSANALHRAWAAGLAASMSRGDWSLLDAAACAPSGVIPDFLAPPPGTPYLPFSEELAQLRYTDHMVVEADVSAAYPAGLPAKLARAMRNPDRFLERVMESLLEFWRRSLAPMWPAMSARLDAEIVYRSRVLALDGAPHILRTLHRDVAFAGSARHGTLTARTRDEHVRNAGGDGMLIIPSVFSWPNVFVVARAPWRPTLAYPARDVVEFWGVRPRRAPVSRLAIIMGEGRAHTLVALRSPRTTTDLARSFQQSASTVSELIASLVAAHLVVRTRIGRNVFYMCNDAGWKLLGIMDDRSEHRPD